MPSKRLAAVRTTRHQSLDMSVNELLSSSAAEMIREPEIIKHLSNFVNRCDDCQYGIISQLRELDRPYLNYTYGEWTDNIRSTIAIPGAIEGWLEIAMNRDFADDVAINAAIRSVKDVSGLVERHVAVLCELLHFNPDQMVFTQLCVFHLYICTYFNITDSAFDGQPTGVQFSSIASQILSAAYRNVSTIGRNHRVDVDWLVDRISRGVDVQREALLQERSCQTMPVSVMTINERRSIIGRADCVFVVISVIEAICGKTLEPELLAGLEDYVVTSQIADDIGDWRDDFIAGRYSLLLRACLARATGAYNVAEIERIMYLDGIYEGFLASVISEMDSLISRFGSRKGTMPLTSSVLNSERRHLFHAFRSVVNLKKQLLTRQVA